MMKKKLVITADVEIDDETNEEYLKGKDNKTMNVTLSYHKRKCVYLWAIHRSDAVT